jgi:hypothetical protein
MSKENLVKLFFLLVTVLILSVLISDIFKSCSRNDKPNIILKTDTLTVVKTVDRPIYITKLKAKLDTIRFTDTLTRYNNDEFFVKAGADTIIGLDSSTIRVMYFFPPDNYFDIVANIKEKVITKTITNEIEKPTTFWDRFNWTIYAGQGYDIIHKDYSISIGVGIGFNLGKIF